MVDRLVALLVLSLPLRHSSVAGAASQVYSGPFDKESKQKPEVLRLMHGTEGSGLVGSLSEHP